MPLKEEFSIQGDFLFKNRSYLPVFILLPACYLMFKIPAPNTPGFEIFCFCISLTGFLIRITTLGYVAKNTSGRNTYEGQVADHVNTTGFYSVVRHPLYLGNFFMWLGLALLTNHFYFVFIFTLIYFLYYERIMFAEEEYLRQKFNVQYELWASETPAFIPAFHKWHHPDPAFNWKKVLKQEKTGFLLLTLLFYIFHVISILGSSGRYELINRWLPIGIIGLLLYILVKLTNKFTTALKE